jgi:ribose transport system substrate-binding protein
MTRRVLLYLAVLGCLLPSGCGGPKTTYKYTIAVVPKGLTHEFWQSIHRGAERAAADLTEQGIAVQVLWNGPAKESDTREQIGIVQQMVGSRGIQGLVLAPQDSKALVPEVKKTTERGIAVVIIDSGLDEPDLFVKYVATDNYNGGRMAAKHLLAELAKKGKAAPKLILFRYAPGSESTEQREKGFEDEIKAVVEKQKKDGKPTVEIVSDNVYANATVDTAQAAAGPLLTRLGDRADGIFAVNESATAGMLNAMRSQKLNGKIVLMGFDQSGPLLQAVREGDVAGLIVQDPYRMGYLAVWTLVRHLEGDDVSAGGKNLSTGEYLVTRENIDDVSTRERFDPALQEVRKITPPTWKKK